MHKRTEKTWASPSTNRKKGRQFHSRAITFHVLQKRQEQCKEHRCSKNKVDFFPFFSTHTKEKWNLDPCKIPQGKQTLRVLNFAGPFFLYRDIYKSCSFRVQKKICHRENLQSTYRLLMADFASISPPVRWHFFC